VKSRYRSPAVHSPACERSSNGYVLKSELHQNSYMFRHDHTGSVKPTEKKSRLNILTINALWLKTHLVAQQLFALYYVSGMMKKPHGLSHEVTTATLRTIVEILAVDQYDMEVMVSRVQ